jgi:CP family cyanate transporter-like MFS transporter
LAGLLVAPTTLPYLWVVAIGAGTGATFPLVLTLVVLRTRTAEDTARLSALAQGGGYLIAALGPLVVGVLHDVTDSWRPGVGFLLALLVPQLATALAAGRTGYVA